MLLLDSVLLTNEICFNVQDVVLMFFCVSIGTIEQLDGHIEGYSASFRTLYHPQRVETARYVIKKT